MFGYHCQGAQPDSGKGMFEEVDRQKGTLLGYFYQFFFVQNPRGIRGGTVIGYLLYCHFTRPSVSHNFRVGVR